LSRLVEPHGGKLVEQTRRYDESLEELQRIEIDKHTLLDLEMISTGAYSPLTGFLCRDDYECVLYGKRLSNGVAWTIPIVCSTNKTKDLRPGDELALSHGNKVVGVLTLEEVYPHNKEEHARKVFQTLDPKHPGVARVKKMGNHLLGGKVEKIEGEASTIQNRFERRTLTPKETRYLFNAKGWRTVVGFQTRNIPHRGHEYLQRCALEIGDGLFIHPIVGETKPGDTPPETILRCYEALIKNYYPRERVVLAVLHTSMRYAGPREAVFHALIRKNFGCSHFIVGRDHAGVGNYYGPYDAQKIFNEFGEGELGIEPLFFDTSFYCRRCGGMATKKTCPHTENDRITPSGTLVRSLLQNPGKTGLDKILRPEVLDAFRGEKIV